MSNLKLADVISFFSTSRGDRNSPFYESQFFTHPDMWSHVSPKMHLQIQDPRLFAGSKAPIFSIRRTFKVDLDDFHPSIQN